MSPRYVDRYMGSGKKYLKISMLHVNTLRENPHRRGTKNKSSKYFDASSYIIQLRAGLMNMVANMKTRYESQNSDAHLPRMTEALPFSVVQSANDQIKNSSQNGTTPLGDELPL